MFVCALAVGAHYAAFNPRFRGWSESAGRGVAGWVIDESSPTKRVEVQIYVDQSFVASRIADLPRPDVVAAGRARDALNGFHFDLPTLPSGEHEARVYAVHESGAGARRTLQLIGRPIRFRVEVEEER